MSPAPLVGRVGEGRNGDRQSFEPTSVDVVGFNEKCTVEYLFLQTADTI